MPSPPYHDPYERPPPRPDVTDPIDSRKDLLDNDLDRNVDIEENSPFEEGIISEICERLDTVLHTRTSGIERPDRHY